MNSACVVIMGWLFCPIQQVPDNTATTVPSEPVPYEMCYHYPTDCVVSPVWPNTQTWVPLGSPCYEHNTWITPNGSTIYDNSLVCPKKPVEHNVKGR